MGAVALGIVITFVIILIFSFVYKSISEKNKTYTWPPHITKCPEYWQLDGEYCRAGEINTGISGALDEQPAYDGSDVVKFTKDLNLSGVHWDGISQVM